MFINASDELINQVEIAVSEGGMLEPQEAIDRPQEIAKAISLMTFQLPVSRLSAEEAAPECWHAPDPKQKMN